MREWIEIGLIARPRGLKGDVWVNPISDDPARLLKLGSFRIELDGVRSELKLAGGRLQNGRLEMRFEGHESREAAEELQGRYLFIHKSQLPRLEEGEVFLADLPGLEVRLADGLVLGRVHDTPEYPSGIMLDVRLGRWEVLIPFNRHFVPELELEQGWLQVQLLEGLVPEGMLAEARAASKGETRDAD